VDVHLDVRIVCATNQNLAERVACGRFRPDLYYRLDELRIDIPPLRQRREDVVPLLRHFLAQAGMSHLEITAGARARLEVHSWPGNVREVRSVARRLLDRAPAGCISEADLSWARPIPGETNVGRDPEEQARQLRRSLYLKELEAHGFNIRETAVALGVAYSTLRSRLKSLDLLVNKPE
jgi:DNA-binding NtrC family response regulator